MNYSLIGAPYNSTDNDNDDLAIKKQQRLTKNKTLKNYSPPINKNQHNEQVKKMIGSIHSSLVTADDENPLADFSPPPHGELQNRKAQAQLTASENQDEINNTFAKGYKVTPLNQGEQAVGPVRTDDEVTTEGFNILKGTNNYTDANTSIGRTTR